MSSLPAGLPRRPLIAAIDRDRRVEVFANEAFTPIIDSDDVAGAYAIWLHEAAFGVSPPRHIHHREDEIFYILEGQLLVWCDGETYTAGTGETVVLPKTRPHSWLVTSATGAKLIATVVPGGLMRFFQDMVRLGAEHDTMPDRNKLMIEYGVEFVGPPLGALDP